MKLVLKREVERNGLFEKKDIRGNVITVFNKDNVINYLDSKLFNEDNK